MAPLSLFAEILPSSDFPGLYNKMDSSVVDGRGFALSDRFCVRALRCVGECGCRRATVT